MRVPRLVRRVAAWSACLALLAVLVAWSGVYSVAASRGHSALLAWVFSFAMNRSVVHHAGNVAVPPLADDSLIQLGAAHFERACAECHGAPGRAPSPVMQRMLPPPPPLDAATVEWSDSELFWIVRHGIRYTGMPGWPAPDRGDEVWGLVAFLRVLPTLDRAAFEALARGEAPPDAPEIAECVACHGAAGRGPRSALVPILHGQPAAFLAGALDAFAKGKRRSGIMQPVAARLARETLPRLAAHYAALGPPPPAAQPSGPSEGGRRLAVDGEPRDGLPPCLACHGEQALAIYPRLAGQPARYLAARLRALREHRPALTAAEDLMAAIARRMSDRQIDEAAAHFEQARGDRR